MGRGNLHEGGACLGFVQFVWLRERHVFSGSEPGLLGLLAGVMVSRLRSERAEQARQESESRLRSIANNLTNGMIYQVVIGWDESRKFTYVSDSVRALYGVSPEEAMADAATIYRRVHPDDAPGLLQAEVEAARTLSTFRCEVRINDPSGAVRWSSFVSTPSVLADGSTIWDGIEFVITERKRAEEALRESQKMESVGRLAGGVAHDFNNTLGVILGVAELELEDADPSTAIYGSLQTIQQAAQRSIDLTRQLLAFARKQPVTRRPLDLNAAVTALSGMLRRLIPEHIQLTCELGAGLGLVMLDPGQVDQIIINLCVNARDAIEGVGTLALSTKALQLDAAFCSTREGLVPGPYVALTVRDSGQGMDAGTLAQIFEPFFTTKTQGRGSGLGLATVYGIIKQNQGYIEATSQPGRGTTFRVYLPQLPAGSDLSAPVPAFTGLSVGHLTVLLVEDEPAMLDLARRLLEGLGHTVLAACTPQEALEIARRRAGPIELLLTDVVMPQMNGKDLAQRVLALHPDMRCLFMSGYTADIIATHGIIDEDVHFLEKPFSQSDLSSRIRDAMAPR